MAKQPELEHQGRHHHATLLTLMLLSGGWKPRPTVWELRRRARYAGWRMTRTGQPIRLARRAELVELLQGEAA